MNKKRPDNRLIIYDSTNQLPYGAQVAVILDETDNFDFAGEASLLLDDKQSIVRVVPCREKIHYNGRISMWNGLQLGRKLKKKNLNYY